MVIFHSFLYVYQRVNGTDMNRDLQVATRGYPIIPISGQTRQKSQDQEGLEAVHRTQHETAENMPAFLVFLVFTSIVHASQSFNLTDLTGYAYMLGLSTAVAYVPLFWAILLVLLKTGAAPMFQLRYMWQRNGYLAPVLLIVLAALGHLEIKSLSTRRWWSRVHNVHRQSTSPQVTESRD